MLKRYRRIHMHVESVTVEVSLNQIIILLHHVLVTKTGQKIQRTTLRRHIQIWNFIAMALMELLSMRRLLRGRKLPFQCILVAPGPSASVRNLELRCTGFVVTNF